MCLCIGAVNSQYERKKQSALLFRRLWSHQTPISCIHQQHTTKHHRTPLPMSAVNKHKVPPINTLSKETQQDSGQISHYTHYILTLHILWFTGLNETLTFYTKQKWANHLMVLHVIPPSEVKSSWGRGKNLKTHNALQ